MGRFLLIFVGNELWKNANFFQSEPSVCLPRTACGKALGFKSHFQILRCPTVSLHLVLHEVLTATGSRRSGSAVSNSPLRKRRSLPNPALGRGRLSAKLKLI